MTPHQDVPGQFEPAGLASAETSSRATLKIFGPARLSGSVSIAGAKNSALRLLAASLLTGDCVTLQHYPAALLDAQVHVEMLRRLGKTTRASGTSIEISESRIPDTTLNWDGRSIRNTLLILGALTTRMGAGRVPLPGGCRLGDRRYDLHVNVLEALGARVWEDDGFLCAEAPANGLTGAEIHLPLRSTGATENAILCGTLARGVTRVWNPHVRPEILDLIALLKKMGARIEVFGQQHIEITGVEELHGAEHDVIADSVEAVTWLVGSVMTGGDVEIDNFPFDDLEVTLAHLKAAGAQLYRNDSALIVRGGTCYPIDISTGPHPGINSDIQPILAAWAARATGGVTGRRPALSRTLRLCPGNGEHGASARDSRRHAGPARCRRQLAGGDGARAGPAHGGGPGPVRPGGRTARPVITDAWQIERGYVDFGQKLRALGVNANWDT